MPENVVITKTAPLESNMASQTIVVEAPKELPSVEVGPVKVSDYSLGNGMVVALVVIACIILIRAYISKK
jgi:hypothetical protein|tara:strand:- start:1449 stop:1658 length:210 start_codon:yes stop_codon:yes gene_type:complete